MKWKNKGHEFDHIGKKMGKHKKIYIYGCGEWGTELYERLQFADCVEGFIDNNVERQKEGYMGKPVESIQRFLANKREDVIVVIAIKEDAFLTPQLLQTGYQLGIDLFDYLSFIHFYLPIYAMYSWDILYYYSISITTTFVCNLKCNACLAFVPQNKHPEHMDLNMLKESIDDFFNAVDYVDFMDIAGGEPLLYPDIEDLVEYVGSRYRRRIRKLYVTTNGTKLPSEELCILMHRYNGIFNIDDYSDSISSDRVVLSEFEIMCVQNNCRYRINKVDKWIDLSFGKVDNSSLTEDELVGYFIACQQEWPELYNSKIHFCDYSTYAARAGIIQEYEDEAFHLKGYIPEKRMELFEYGRGFSDKGYVEMCKYCAGYLGINQNYVAVAEQVKKE